VTSSAAVFRVPILAKSMYMKKIVIENQNKRKSIKKSNEFCHQSPSERLFMDGIHSLLS